MKHFSSIFFLMLLMVSATAQTIEYEGVRKFNGRGVGEITKNDELVGYYTFFEVEKVDKKNVIYQVDIADNNLNKVSTFEIKRDKMSRLFEVAFNGENFLLTFFAPKGKKSVLEYLVYSKNGEELGSYIAEDLSKWQTQQMSMQLQQEEVASMASFSAGSQGFIVTHSIDVGKKNGYVVIALSNSAEVLWKHATKEGNPEHELGDIVMVTPKYIAVNRNYKKSVLSGDNKLGIVAIDTKTGDELFDFDLASKGAISYNMQNCFIDDSKDQFLLIGEMYKEGDKVGKDPSTGLFIRVLDKEGSEVTTNKYLWAKDIAKVKKQKMSEEQKENEKKCQLFVHKVTRSKDGTLTLIAEQYRKAISAGGMAMKALGANASGIEIQMLNMVLIQFDSELAIKDYTLVEKKMRRVYLQEGMGYYPPAVLGMFMKMYGHFDYCFTSTNSKTDQSSVIYTDADRAEEGSKKKNDVMVGVININGGEVTNSKTPINSETNWYTLKPGKTGHIMVTEYFRKGRRVVLRIESLK